jgi:hypothetical protein
MYQAKEGDWFGIPAIREARINSGYFSEIPATRFLAMTSGEFISASSTILQNILVQYSDLP